MDRKEGQARKDGQNWKAGNEGKESHEGKDRKCKKERTGKKDRKGTKHGEERKRNKGKECVVDRGMEGGEKKSRTLLAAWINGIIWLERGGARRDGCAEREREREVAGANEWHARQMYWWLLPPAGGW